MGLIEEVNEIVRRSATGDSWYVEEGSYVLELRAPPAALLITALPVNYIVLPVGLQGYGVTRVFRQSISPTLGGLVSEEQGELYKQITVEWDPGLVAKRAVDTSSLPETNPFAFGLSGPAWSLRVLRNYFDVYARLKSDPQFSADTVLIWHDLKAGDHWVVVPSRATVDRMTAKRMRYPLTFEFTTLGDAAALVPAALSQGALASVRNAVESAVSNVAKGVSLISAALQEGTSITGEVRLFAAKVDSVLTNVQIAINAANDFAAGVTDTLNIGRDFLASIADTVDALCGDLEDSGMPDAVRQSFLQISDGVDTIAAQRSAFGTTYATTTDRISQHEQGPVGLATQEELDAAEAAGPARNAAEYGRGSLSAGSKTIAAAGLAPTPRPFAQYSSFVSYTIKSADSLASIAAKYLGDGALWYDLALLNQLKAPYISVVPLPDTVAPGDAIKIPSNAGAPASEKEDQDDSIYLTDLAWVETSDSRPGAPRVTLAVDESTLTDARLVSGIENLSQALWLRNATERGSLPLVPEYGARRILGLKGNPQAFSLIKLAVRENILADPRVSTVKRVMITRPAPDQVELELDVVPIGDTSTQTIRSILV